jgi:hypothetical protein
VEGREAKVTFHLVKGGLGSLVVSWTERFGDMGQCSDEFAHVRQSLDAILGESSSDNLAAYWDSETLQASLDCSPEASGQGYLKLRVEDPRTSR